MDIQRCPWAGISDPIYAAYHDNEWGVPQGDDRVLFEKLILEGFQSGLSWLTILRKRDHFRAAFDGFDAEKMAHYGEKDVARLLGDAGIVRHRLKIESAILSAQAYVKLRDETTLADFVWAFAEDRARSGALKPSEIPAQTDSSVALSKALKKRGFRFVGPTTMYAGMQSMGMVNDHTDGCHRHEACGQLQAAFRKSRLKGKALRGAG